MESRTGYSSRYGAKGPVGMWPVGWWSGTRMKECERWVKI